MMTPPVFEIRVAVIGYVSVGKTTVINALFGAEYGQVSMKRTTAVVNNFRISTKSQVDTTQGQSNAGSVTWSTIVDVPCTANEALKQSKSDNLAFRNGEDVKEKSYDIVLEEPLHDMRENTKLVLVDIPGINEAGTSSMYKDYVNNQWHTFDIAVIVMDGRQGVNTEEQLDLLKLVKSNNEASKDVPIIILFNKVDDTDDEEQGALFTESRKEIEKVFGVADRKHALSKFLKTFQAFKKSELSLSLHSYDASLLPAVIPVSAMHAFLYRCGAKMSFEEFSRMDKNFIEKIGKESYGRQWRRFDTAKKLKMAFKAVSDEEQRQDGVEASNFGTFAAVLQYCIGDHARQLSLIRKQVAVSVKRVAEVGSTPDIGYELTMAYRNLSALGESTAHLPTAFWSAYTRLEEVAFAMFKKDRSPSPFANPIKQLASYFKFLSMSAWDGEKDKVIDKVKKLTVRYAVEVMNRMDRVAKPDHFLILGSMLLFSHDWAFCMHLGEVKLELEARYMAANSVLLKKEGVCGSCQRPTSLQSYSFGKTEYCSSCRRQWIDKASNCPQCNTRLKLSGSYASCCGYSYGFRALPSIKYENGRIVRVAGDLENTAAVQYVVPDSPRDPEHYGHVIWQCCVLLKAFDSENEN